MFKFNSRIIGATQFLGFSKLLRLSNPNDAALGRLITYCTGDQERIHEAVVNGVLLLVMSLMGGGLIVITSGDHQSNNTSDQYQQAFYVAETALIEAEKTIVNQYLGPWMKVSDIPAPDG